MKNNSQIKVEFLGNTTMYADIASAKSAVRELIKDVKKPSKLTVTVPEGTYSNKDFVFTEEDCSDIVKVIWKADGDVTITAGLSVPKAEWKEPDSEMADRFDADVLPNIKMISLTDYGLTKDDWGEEVAIGTYKMDRLYDDASRGSDIGFFIGEHRMIKARYPNEGFNFFNVVDPGDTKTQRNPYGGEYRIDQETADRIKTWKDQTGAWIFAYYVFDWADGSSPVKFNTDTLSLFPKYIACGAGEVSEGFGFKPKYYLYNIPEELDVVGEWYLDRESGNLYFWPYDDADSADFYFKNELIISLTNTKNMVFRGFTLTGTAGNVIDTTCDNMTFDRLHVKKIGGRAMTLRGWKNTVSNSEFEHLGRGGIDLTGGVEATLTHGENRITNNYIHHFSEVYSTYQGGIVINGCGNIADHNEVCYTPHSAVSLGGSEHLFEYNYIHHAVSNSSDAGAIYQGGNWSSRGTVMRYNIISDIGGYPGYYPNGIYFDDGMSGQTAYGNIITKCQGFAFLIGGGRENIVKHNIIVHSNRGINYDDRYRDGFVGDGWAQGIKKRGSGMWNTLNYVPYLEEPWKSKYPLLAKTNLSEDPAVCDDPDFPINPAYSRIDENVFIDVNVMRENLLRMSDSVYVYSSVEGNIDFQFRDESDEKAGWDPEVFNLRDDSPVYSMIPDFEKIPVDKIGRIGIGIGE
ncbi:MAG: right-handed parallel beta-helix repeat-containing protein [Ruminococcaceae bacterium]|nr:right-handed parallel beta-helix repeat-containing protein [Oscillospiraceae bacterium]